MRLKNRCFPPRQGWLFAPVQSYLICKTMEWSCQPVHGCCKSQVRVREGTAHQMASVSTDVSTLMVTAGERRGQLQEQLADKCAVQCRAEIHMCGLVSIQLIFTKLHEGILIQIVKRELSRTSGIKKQYKNQIPPYFQDYYNISN